MIGWISDCNTLKLSHNRAHQTRVRSWSWRCIENFKLLLLQRFLNVVHEGFGVLVSPEVEIDCMKPEEEVPFISRICTWQSPVMFQTCFTDGQGRTPILIAVHYYSTQCWVFVRPSNFRCIEVLIVISPCYFVPPLPNRRATYTQ